MHLRVAVNLGCRSLKNPCFHALGEAQHVDSPDDARLRGLYGIALVMNGRSRTGEVVDLIHFHIKREGDVVADRLETRMTEEALHALVRPSEEIVHADDVRAGLDKLLAKVRPHKTRSASNKHAFFEMHPKPYSRTPQP